MNIFKTVTLEDSLITTNQDTNDNPNNNKISNYDLN